MPSMGRVCDRLRLEEEIARTDSCGLYARLIAELPAEIQVQGWGDLWDDLDERSWKDPVFDRMARSALMFGAKDGADAPNAILLRMFWPKLVILAGKRWYWDRCPEDLWQAIVLAFLHATRHLRRRGTGELSARTLINQTTHRLYESYERLRRMWRCEVQVEPEQLVKITWVWDDPGFLRAKLARAQQRVLDRLAHHRGHGRLDETDELILMASRVYGIPLKTVSGSLGLPYERLKKRRQRLEKRLSRSDHFPVPVDRKTGPLPR